MNPIDPRSQAAFDAAISHLKTTTAAVADRVSNHLGTLASAAMRIYERDILITAQLDLRRHMSTFVLVFGRADQERNPLRGEVMGASVFRAIESVSNERETRKVLAREMSLALSR